MLIAPIQFQLQQIIAETDDHVFHHLPNICIHKIRLLRLSECGIGNKKKGAQIPAPIIKRGK